MFSSMWPITFAMSGRCEFRYGTLRCLDSVLFREMSSIGFVAVMRWIEAAHDFLIWFSCSFVAHFRALRGFSSARLEGRSNYGCLFSHADVSWHFGSHNLDMSKIFPPIFSARSFPMCTCVNQFPPWRTDSSSIPPKSWGPIFFTEITSEWHGFVFACRDWNSRG